MEKLSHLLNEREKELEYEKMKIEQLRQSVLKFENGNIDQEGLRDLGLPAKMAANYILLQRENKVLNSHVATIKDKLKNYKNKVKILNAKVIDLLQEKREYINTGLAMKENVHTQNAEEFHPIRNFQERHIKHATSFYPTDRVSFQPHEIQGGMTMQYPPNSNFQSFQSNRLMQTEPVKRMIQTRTRKEIEFELDQVSAINPANTEGDFYKSLPIDNLFHKRVQEETKNLYHDGRADDGYFNEEGIAWDVFN